MAQVVICPSKISDPDMRALCAACLDAAKRFYADPKNLQEFEQWKRKKEELKSE